MILVDMPMPIDCPMCPMAHYARGVEFMGCEIVNGKRYAMKDPIYANTSTRPEWCPLKEVADVSESD